MQKFIIDFKNDTTQAQIDQYVSECGGQVIKTWNSFDKIVEIETDQTPTQTDIVEAIVSDDQPVIEPLACSVEYNPTLFREDAPGLPSITFSTDTEQDWWKNYVLKTPELEAPTKTIPRKGSNVTVYVVDSGIDAAHPEFVNADIDDLFTVTSGDFSDENGHGTAIASVIVGNTTGLTQSTVKNVKIFRNSGGTYISELLSAMDAIMLDHNPAKWNIVNMSWAIDRNTWLESKIQQMIDLGIVVIAAAGNNGSPIQNVTPAAMNDVFVVGSYGPQLTPSDFSNYTGTSGISYTGDETNFGALDVWAPGEQIWVALPGGQYGFTAGTSMSAAIASAVAAYTFSDFVNLSTGDKSAGYRNINSPSHPLAHTLTFGNVDIITFDQKYENSSAGIMVIHNGSSANVSAFSSMTDVINWTIIPDADAIEVSGPRVVNPYITTLVEEVEALPDGFSISSCGTLMWRYDESLLPQDGQIFRLVTGKIRVVENDGYEEVRDIGVFITNANYQPSDLPADSQVNINLLFNCSGKPVYECGLDVPGTCLDYCTGDTACCASLFKGYVCNCFPLL